MMANLLSPVACRIKPYHLPNSFVSLISLVFLLIHGPVRIVHVPPGWYADSKVHCEDDPNKPKDFHVFFNCDRMVAVDCVLAKSTFVSGRPITFASAPSAAIPMFSTWR